MKVEKTGMSLTNSGRQWEQQANNTLDIYCNMLNGTESYIYVNFVFKFNNLCKGVLCKAIAPERAYFCLN